MASYSRSLDSSELARRPLDGTMYTRTRESVNSGSPDLPKMSTLATRRCPIGKVKETQMNDCCAGKISNFEMSPTPSELSAAADDGVNTSPHHQLEAFESASAGDVGQLSAQADVEQ
jgi:hypothetical protein